MEVAHLGGVTENKVSVCDTPAKSHNMNPIKRKHRADPKLRHSLQMKRPEPSQVTRLRMSREDRFPDRRRLQTRQTKALADSELDVCVVAGFEGEFGE